MWHKFIEGWTECWHFKTHFQSSICHSIINLCIFIVCHCVWESFFLVANHLPIEILWKFFRKCLVNKNAFHNVVCKVSAILVQSQYIHPSFMMQCGWQIPLDYIIVSVMLIKRTQKLGYISMSSLQLGNNWFPEIDCVLYYHHHVFRDHSVILGLLTMPCDKDDHGGILHNFYKKLFIWYQYDF